MAYELWHTTSRNLLGTYDTQDAALMVVSKTLRDDGLHYVRELALGYEDARGRSRSIAAGDALADLACAWQARLAVDGRRSPERDVGGAGLEASATTHEHVNGRSVGPLAPRDTIQTADWKVRRDATTGRFVSLKAPQR